MKRCDFDEGLKTRCRKAARYAVGYRVVLGHQIGPHGEVPVYQIRLALRCEAHTLTVPGERCGAISIQQYERECGLDGG